MNCIVLYNLWMSCLRPDTSYRCLCQCVNTAISNNFQNNCQQFQNTVMCTLCDFLSGKVRFMHTSTVTRSRFNSEKTTRTSCYYSKVRVAYNHLYRKISHLHWSSSREMFVGNNSPNFGIRNFTSKRNFN